MEQTETDQTDLSVQSATPSAQSVSFSLLRTLADGTQEVITRVGAFAEAAIADLKAGLIETQELKTGFIFPLADGQLTIDLGRSPPQASESAFGRLIIKGEAGQEVASIDSQGNVYTEGSITARSASFGGLLEVAALEVAGDATVAGTLTAEEVKTNELTVDTIYADQIIARSGSFGELNSATFSAEPLTAEQVAELESRLAALEATFQRPKPSPSLSPEPVEGPTPTPSPQPLSTGPPEASPTPEATDSARPRLVEPEQPDREIIDAALSQPLITDVSADTTLESLTINQGLTVLGPASLADTTIAGSLMIDASLTLGNSAINTLTEPLYLQNLGLAGVDILAGKVVIDKDGNVTIRGSLFANIISPLPEQDLTIDLRRQSLDSSLTSNIENLESDFGRLLVKGVDDQVVASIDASGSATFAQLLTDKLVIAGSEATISASFFTGVVVETNATAGTATIPTGERQITIQNPNVTDYTLVYITPISSTLNNVLYVKQKRVGQFVVGFDRSLPVDVDFDWWVIDVAPVGTPPGG